MAKRLRNMVFEVANDLTGGYIWADWEVIEQVSKIEGVHEVGELRSNGSHTVYIDPRYNAAEVVKEIEALA